MTRVLSTDANPHRWREVRFSAVQFPYARHRGTRGRIVLVRRDRVREPPRSDSDSKRREHNDLFLRSERQPLPKNDRRRHDDVYVGLCEPPHGAGLWRRNHYLRLRRFRLARLPDYGHVHEFHDLSVNRKHRPKLKGLDGLVIGALWGIGVVAEIGSRRR